MCYYGVLHVLALYGSSSESYLQELYMALVRLHNIQLMHIEYKQDIQCAYNIESQLRNHCDRGKTITI
jgi:hypothetical protein